MNTPIPTLNISITQCNVQPLRRPEDVPLTEEDEQFYETAWQEYLDVGQHQDFFRARLDQGGMFKAIHSPRFMRDDADALAEVMKQLMEVISDATYRRLREHLSNPTDQ